MLPLLTVKHLQLEYTYPQSCTTDDPIKVVTLKAHEYNSNKWIIVATSIANIQGMKQFLLTAKSLPTLDKVSQTNHIYLSSFTNRHYFDSE